MYDLDLGRHGLSMDSRVMFCTLFKYFSIVDKIEIAHRFIHCDDDSIGVKVNEICDNV